ncbi:hypothetical protein ABZS66_44685 [Dactylosporangium sp. NPDC005572]|uniref:hypothetical protein n=1 Tax=Dactylosporangium sp. NPDC005572 TaxID=3156889 RepID=UPI0033BC1E94
MPRYSVGERLRSRVSTVEVVVVRASSADLEVTCAGVPVARDGEEMRHQGSGAFAGEETLLGKRYEDQNSGLELLCVVPGSGRLAVAERPLALKSPKPLPSSD